MSEDPRLMDGPNPPDIWLGNEDWKREVSLYQKGKWEMMANRWLSRVLMDDLIGGSRRRPRQGDRRM